VKGKAQVGMGTPTGSRSGYVGSGTGRALPSAIVGPSSRNSHDSLEKARPQGMQVPTPWETPWSCRAMTSLRLQRCGVVGPTGVLQWMDARFFRIDRLGR